MQARKLSRYLAAAALAAGVVISTAYAQSGLPPVQTRGDVSFVSGGVGQDESTAFQHEERNWPLSLRFTGPGGEFLADVRVSISDAKGGEVLQADSRGPYMLVKLAPGRYTVRATHAGREERRSVAVSASGSARAQFEWAK